MKEHGKKYREQQAKVEADKLYTARQAVALAKATSYTKFDGTVEVHMRLGVDPKHADQNVRDVVVLPHGLGKDVTVAVFAGERPTGGYTVEFLDPVPKGMDVIVRYRVNEPTGFSTQAIAQPWKVRAFPRVRGQAFVEEAKPEAKKK